MTCTQGHKQLASHCSLGGILRSTFGIFGSILCCNLSILGCTADVLGCVLSSLACSVQDIGSDILSLLEVRLTGLTT